MLASISGDLFQNCLDLVLTPDLWLNSFILIPIVWKMWLAYCDFIIYSTLLVVDRKLTFKSGSIHLTINGYIFIFFILNKQFQPQMWFRTDHKISWTRFTPVCAMNT